MSKREIKLRALVAPTQTVIVSAYDHISKVDACTLAFYMVSRAQSQANTVDPGPAVRDGSMPCFHAEDSLQSHDNRNCSAEYHNPPQSSPSPQARRSAPDGRPARDSLPTRIPDMRKQESQIYLCRPPLETEVPKRSAKKSLPPASVPGSRTRYSFRRSIFRNDFLRTGYSFGSSFLSPFSKPHIKRHPRSCCRFGSLPNPS